MPRSTLRRTAILTALLASAICAPAADTLRPTFVSEVMAPRAGIVFPLLKAACGDGVRTVTIEGKRGFGCGDSMDEILATRHRPRRYPWTAHISWQADGVIFGHFLSPTSDDVAINCYACETHPSLYGGTLLLTRRAGQWQPVWYKPGVITRHCRRIRLATGRQILLCEETDGGMGHRLHGLYIVDFTQPSHAWSNKVLMADTYSSFWNGGVQTQFIDRVRFEEAPGRGLLLRVFVRHGNIPLRLEDQDKFEGRPLPKPKLSRFEIHFRLDGAKFTVTPQTAAAARRFGLPTPPGQ